MARISNYSKYPSIHYRLYSNIQNHRITTTKSNTDEHNSPHPYHVETEQWCSQSHSLRSRKCSFCHRWGHHINMWWCSHPLRAPYYTYCHNPDYRCNRCLYRGPAKGKRYGAHRNRYCSFHNSVIHNNEHCVVRKASLRSGEDKRN